MAEWMRGRRCDCGCGRRVSFHLKDWDLAFSDQCLDLFREAHRQYCETLVKETTGGAQRHSRD